MKQLLLLLLFVMLLIITNAQQINVTKDSIYITHTFTNTVERYSHANWLLKEQLQIAKSKKVPTVLPKKIPQSHYDTTTLKKLVAQYLKINSASTNNMPNAINPNTYTNSQKKIGNNGRGFDVYKDDLEGMIVLKPDNTNTTAPMGIITVKPIKPDVIGKELILTPKLLEPQK